jgi:hypothetical protein
MTLFLRGTIYVGLAMACAIAVASQSQPAGRPAPRRNPSQQQQSRSAQPSEVDQRGTENSPIVVKVLPAPKTPEETAQERAARNDLSAANWWMVRLTGLIFIIGALQTLVFWIQATRLKKTIEKMDEIATGQTKDMRDSINAAARAADAMEGVAESLAQNVRDVQESVAISREIADRQKLITELGARAYLSVLFENAIYQDASHIFESIVTVVNRGNTPAYEVTFEAAADIVPVPVPDDFNFPLSPADAGTSVSIIAPQTNKIIRRTAATGRVPDEEVELIKSGGPPRCLAMWGVLKYKDAFREPRYVKFAFTVYWAGTRKDGSPIIMSADTAHYNDSN